MKAEIRELKKLSKKSKFKPSGMEKRTEPNEDKDDNDDEKGSGKKLSGRQQGQRSNTASVKIHNEEIIQPIEPLSEGARLKGYRKFTVQDMKVASFNTLSRLAHYLLPDGSTLMGKLPKGLK
ncbi:MAG: hypothetical protein GY928_09525 [Colwellia sp.]|nr:hypothetical protein [Colwellia sp.]